MTSIRSATELPDLTQLNVSSTAITDKFLEYCTINNCYGLTKLNLSKTFVSKDGLLKLALPYLKQLKVDGDQNGVEVRLKQCPNLQGVIVINAKTDDEAND